MNDPSSSLLCSSLLIVPVFWVILLPKSNLRLCLCVESIVQRNSASLCLTEYSNKMLPALLREVCRGCGFGHTLGHSQATMKREQIRQISPIVKMQTV